MPKMTLISYGFAAKKGSFVKETWQNICLSTFLHVEKRICLTMILLWQNGSSSPVSIKIQFWKIHIRLNVSTILQIYRSRHKISWFFVCSWILNILLERFKVECHQWFTSELDLGQIRNKTPRIKTNPLPVTLSKKIH